MLATTGKLRVDQHFVEDPFKTWERENFVVKHHKGKRQAKKSSQCDVSIPEPFQWARRPGASSTVQINAILEADRVARENKKTMGSVRRIRAPRRSYSPSRAPLPESHPQYNETSGVRYKPCLISDYDKRLSHSTSAPLAAGATGTSRMFESLSKLPDSTFRKIADIGLTPSMSATLLLVGRGDDEPRMRRARSTDSALNRSIERFVNRSDPTFHPESLERRAARKRGGILTAIDHENHKVLRRLALPKRQQHHGGRDLDDRNAMMDRHKLAKWHADQKHHMRRACNRPYVMGGEDALARAKKERPSELQLLHDSQEDATAIISSFQHKASSRVFEIDTKALLDTTNDNYSMERWMIEKASNTSVFDNVQNSLPELLTMRRDRIGMTFDGWKRNVQMLRKYRRIFMNRIIRVQRQRLQNCFEMWVEFYDEVLEQRRVAEGLQSDSPPRSSTMSERDRQAAKEKIWEEKAMEKQAAKKLELIQKNADKKEEARKAHLAEMAALRQAAVERQAELAGQRALEDERKRDELADQLKALEVHRKRETDERRRQEAADADRLEKEAEEQAKLDKAADLTLALFANQRAVSMAKQAQEEPEDIEDQFNKMMGKGTEKEAAADPASRLAAMSLEQLLAKAADSGLSAEEVDEIDDEGDPKAALIALLLPLELAQEGEADA